MDDESNNDKVFTGCSFMGWDPTLQMPQSAEGFAGNQDASEVRIPIDHDVPQDDTFAHHDVCRPDDLVFTHAPITSIHILDDPHYHARCANLRSEPAPDIHDAYLAAPRIYP